MISNKQIIEGVREALSKAFKLWLEENRAEVIRMVAESVVSTVKPPKEVPQQPRLSGQFFTAKQLAERWHLHPVSVLRMLRSGMLPCVWVGRRKLVPMSAVQEYEKGSSQQATR
jgi:hypothetical protein